MKKLTKQILQVPLSALVGLAIYYLLQTFTPLSNNVIVVIAVLVTSAFAEFIGIQLK